ncbi:unannotated protein [freshwater metagenome]|uniref:Unannotated protein n=1 Tax=freshwater metagenome TaxID=449393 RepID=A0A6J7DRR1_9ZZZZ|nr:30S ribosomal protein S16 [Actinomycetota bacterium]
MSVKIKLKRLGKIRQPMYRIVVADARTARNGRAIEEIGIYRPKEDPSFIQVDSERVAYWLSVGAQPTDAVTAILKVTGDWQSFKGLPAPEPMKVAAPAVNKRDVFAAAVKEAADAPKDGATTPKAKKAPVAKEAAPAEVDVVEVTSQVSEVAEPSSEAPVAEQVVAEESAPEVVAQDAAPEIAAESAPEATEVVESTEA